MTVVYLIGRYVETEHDANWVIDGIFTNKEAALAGGKQEGSQFLMTVPLDEIYAPGEIREFEEWEYLNGWETPA